MVSKHKQTLTKKCKEIYDEIKEKEDELIELRQNDRCTAMKGKQFGKKCADLEEKIDKLKLDTKPCPKNDL